MLVPFVDPQVEEGDQCLYVGTLIDDEEQYSRFRIVLVWGGTGLDMLMMSSHPLYSSFSLCTHHSIDQSWQAGRQAGAWDLICPDFEEM